MDIIKVLAVVPYAGLGELMLSTCQKFPQMKLTVCMGDLAEGVQAAKAELQEQEYDLIISRGGTAELLEKELDIPVVAVSISVFDILQAVKLAENYEGKLAVVGFPSITYHTELLRELMQYEIDVYMIHDGNEVEKQLMELKAANYGIVLCDMVASTVARKIGLNAILITSGVESIESAFQQATYLYSKISAQVQQGVMAKQVLSFAPVHSLVLNSHGSILYASSDQIHSDALLLLKQASAPLAIGENARTQKALGDDLFDIYARVDDFGGDTVTYGYIHRKPGAALKGFQSFTRKELSGEMFSSFYSSDHSVGAIRDTLERYSASLLPILLIGEPGTGKDSAAAYLHERSAFVNHPFNIIDCGSMNERLWRALIDKVDSPFNDIECTLYFKNIHRLDQVLHPLFYELFEQAGLQRRNRIVFSCQGLDGKAPEILQFVLSLPDCISLFLPPLRERASDLQNLATLYINQLNSLLGKQIIGFQPDAFEEMQAYRWRQNIEQFKRVLRQLAVETEGFYISKDTVLRNLSQENRFYAPAAIQEGGSIDLSKSLSEITREVIEAVVLEEKGNQKRAAERLGISRSTIWRILKEVK